MKTNKLLMTLPVFALLLAACEGKLVVKGPNPNLDPAPSQRTTVSGQDDARASEQWAAKTLGLEQVWKAPANSKRIKVAVLSSGIDYNHEDLRNNIYVNVSELVGSDQDEGKALAANKVDGEDSDHNGYVDDVVGYDFVENDGYAFDRSGLGTAVAGVIGAVHSNGVGIKGVMSDVNMVPVRYIDGNGRATLPRMLQALKYAAAVNSDVVYLHFTNVKFHKVRGEEDTFILDAEKRGLAAAVQVLADKGIPLVVSAGNNGESLDGKSPVLDVIRRASNVIVVTSTDASDAKPFIANFGPQSVDMGAPGSDIVTTQPGNKYSSQSGSYLSGAYVTGALGLAISKTYGASSGGTVIKKLKSESGGDSVVSLDTSTVTGRRLNIQKFLSSL